MCRDDTTRAPFLLYEYEEGGRNGLLHGVFHDHADLAAVLKDAPYGYG